MELVELKIEDYCHLLMTTLRTFSKTNTLTKIGFVSEANNAGANSCILAVHQEICSGLFKRLYQGLTLESQAQYYFLCNNIRLDLLRKAIDFMYLGCIDMINDDLEDFYKVLDFLKLSESEYSSICDPDLNTRFNLHDHDEYLTRLWYSRSELECDVVFVTSDFLKLSAHSLVLSGNSTYLLNLFMKNRAKQKPFTFILENVKREQLESVVEFCYRGKTCVLKNKLREVFEVARLLGVNALCEKILRMDPGVASCKKPTCRTDISSSIKAAHSSKLDDPSKQCTQFFSKIINQEQLCDISLVSGNNIYRLHLAVLIEFSPFFLNFVTKCNVLKDSFVLMKDLNARHTESFINYLYNGETEFCGSTKDFHHVMKDWIDFDMLPICESIERHILSSSTSRTDVETNGGGTHQFEDSALVSLEASEDIPGVEGCQLQTASEKLAESAATVTKEGDVEELADKLVTESIAVTPSGPSVKQPRVKKCHTCSEEFPSYKLLAEHTAIHPEARIMKCEYCGKKFDRESQMNLHSRTHTGARPYTCSDCGISFAAKSAAVKHRLTHSTDSSKLFVCDICKKTFSRKQYMEEHIRSHTGNKPYECTICHKTFVGRTGLNHHTKTHDRNPESVCEICGKSFTRHALWTHMKQHDKTHQCASCHKYYPTNSALSIHMASTHQAERNHQCEVCGKGFVQKTHLDRHSKVHKQTKKTANESKFLCEKCTKGFKSEAQLQSHVKRAHSGLGEKPYACEICHKTFAGRSTAIYHQRGHTGELPFSCGTCGKRFARPDTYRKHVRLHNNDSKPTTTQKRATSRNFECHLCFSTYCSKSALQKHINNSHASHLDPETISEFKSRVSDLTCTICNKPFKTAMQCNAHIRSHSAMLKRLSCAICSRTFRSESVLTKHLEVHTMSASPARELPPIYTFQQCEPSYSNSFASEAFVNNTTDSQYHNVDDQDNHNFVDVKSSVCSHRSSNIDNDLCINEGDKLIHLHEGGTNVSVDPALLTQDSSIELPFIEYIK